MNAFELSLRRKFVPEVELLGDLRRVAEELQGQPVTREAYTARGRFNGTTLSKRFGSWSQALAAAGLPPTGYRMMTDEAMFENLAAVWRALGRQPIMADLHLDAGHSQVAPATYQKRFGSWNAALLRFSAYQDGSDWRAEARPNRAPIRPSATFPPTTGGRKNDSRRIPGWRLRARVLLRDRATCQLCGASPAKDPATVLHVDHVVPWSKGGETVEGNLRTLCERCNVGKSNLATDERG